MSMKAFRWAKAQTGLSSAQKFVLVMISDHYNDGEKRSWPSIATLAAETEQSRSTVQRAIRHIEGRGLIAIEPWKNADTGVNLSNRYCLPLFDPTSKPAAKLPVVVTASFGPHGEYEYDGRVPGSNLVKRGPRVDKFEEWFPDKVSPNVTGKGSGNVSGSASDLGVTALPRGPLSDPTPRRTVPEGW